MSQEKLDFEKISPELLYDAVFPTIQDWAAARNLGTIGVAGRQEEYMSAAKMPVVPFARLRREIGASPDVQTEVREMTLDRQQRISNWVGLISTPFDQIQRAEGFETPQMVFYGGKNHATKNMEPGIDKALVRSSSGRAAVRRQYDTTNLHYETALERSGKAITGMKSLSQGLELEDEERVAILEILQELANGLAANIDNSFVGGDTEARIAGNSILNVAVGIEKAEIDPLTQRRLINAAVGYVKKQERFWSRKLKIIYNFAAEQGFTVGQPKTESTE